MVHADIRGQVNGDICGAGRVRVASTGLCRSRILADYLEVAGEVKGVVEAGRLVVLRTGRVHGGARFKSLFIQPGGILEVGQDEYPTDAPRRAEAEPAPRDPVKVTATPPAPECETVMNAGPPASASRPSGPVFHISF
ncbi:MAG: polymer-forming cytoskeletal protein [Bacillota bacterium]